MNVLGNSKKKILSAAQKRAVDEYGKDFYKRYVNHVKACCQLFMLISLHQTMEHYGFSKLKQKNFRRVFMKNLDELNRYLESNTYTTGRSDHQQFDVEYNQAKLRELAAQYDIELADDVFEF